MTSDFDDYQSRALRTLPTGLSHKDMLNLGALGVCGESGEAGDVVKKYLFHGHELDRLKLQIELGDVLWYVAVLCHALGVNMSDVATGNVDKLKRRYPEGFSPTASRERTE